VIESEFRDTVRRARFAIPAAPQSAALARKMATAVLRTWAVPVDQDAAVLMLCEVFTNAVLHAVDTRSMGVVLIGVELVERACGLHVEVHDPNQGGGNVAITHDAPQMREFGRGLELVEALSDNWGWKDTGTGKFVFFDIDAPDEAEPDESREATEPVDSLVDPRATAHVPGQTPARRTPTVLGTQMRATCRLGSTVHQHVELISADLADRSLRDATAARGSAAVPAAKR
jgi:anti-sigma regulatory factor (Ser/Thr protein kinase)